VPLLGHNLVRLVYLDEAGTDGGASHLAVDLAKIIQDLGLPVVAGTYEKDKYGLGILSGDETPLMKKNLVHNAAAFDCLLHTDRWLERYAPNELAIVIHEDGPTAKRLVKEAVRVMRDGAAIRAHSMTPEVIGEVGLPLKRIIDTVHFAEKADGRPLQLADLCAFMLARGFRGLDVPIEPFRRIFSSLRWIMDMRGRSSDADRASDLLGISESSG
jgi:hypothetical protein